MEVTVLLVVPHLVEVVVESVLLAELVLVELVVVALGFVSLLVALLLAEFGRLVGFLAVVEVFVAVGLVVVLVSVASLLRVVSGFVHLPVVPAAGLVVVVVGMEAFTFLSAVGGMVVGEFFVATSFGKMVAASWKS